MKLLVAGGRNYSLNNKGFSYLDRLHEDHNFTELVNGMAAGVDNSARIWAKLHNIPIKEFPTRWNDLNCHKYLIKINKYGKKYNAGAGIQRNKDMLEYLDKGDFVIVFPGGSGSSHMLFITGHRSDINLYNLMDTKEYVYESK